MIQNFVRFILEQLHQEANTPTSNPIILTTYKSPPTTTEEETTLDADTPTTIPSPMQQLFGLQTLTQSKCSVCDNEASRITYPFAVDLLYPKKVMCSLLWLDRRNWSSLALLHHHSNGNGRLPASWKPVCIAKIKPRHGVRLAKNTNLLRQKRLYKAYQVSSLSILVRTQVKKLPYGVKMAQVVLKLERSLRIKRVKDRQKWPPGYRKGKEGKGGGRILRKKSFFLLDLEFSSMDRNWPSSCCRSIRRFPLNLWVRQKRVLSMNYR